MLSQASTNQNSDVVGGHMAFLRRVTEDDRFRAALEADPQAALAEFGLSVEAGQIPSEVRLPSQDQLAFLLNPEDDNQDDFWPNWYGLLSA